MQQARERSAIFLFIVLVLGSSICYWAEVSFLPKGAIPHWLQQGLWGILRGFGPALAAIAAWYYANGYSGLRDLASRATRWNVSKGMYLLAFAMPFAIVLIVTFGAVVFGKMDPHPSAVSPLRMVVIFFAMAIVDGPLGEELGWRGFLLPKLLEKSGAVTAAVTVGVIWYVWHLPLYIADARDLPPQFYVQFFLSCTTLSVIFAWFFLRTKQSALFAVLLHNASNYSIYLSRLLFPKIREVPFSVWLYTGLLLVVAVAAGMSMMTARRTPAGVA